MKNWDGEAFNPDRLPGIVEQFFGLLLARQIDYVLVGGIAMLSYVEGRNTQDIDFILPRSALLELPEVIISEENRDFARGDFSGLQIDFLLTQNKLFERVKRQFVTRRSFGEITLRTVTVEGLVLLKLYALPSLYRQGKFDRASLYESDVTLLLLNYAIELEPLTQILKKYLIASDLAELAQTMTEIEARIRRFRQSHDRLVQNEQSEN
jgi:hypothetical protein